MLRRSPLRVAPLAAFALAIVVALPAAAASAAAPTGEPTVEEARQFIAAAEQRLLDLWIDRDRAQWVQSNFITVDTELMAAAANEQVITAAVELAGQATRFDELELPAELARKMKMLKLSLTMPAPADPAKTAELARIGAQMEGTYGRFEYCRDAAQEPAAADPTGASAGTQAADSVPPETACLGESEMTNILAESRDPAELLEIWQAWHRNARELREPYARNVALGNEGARDLGFADLGAMWRSKYDLEPDAFAAELDRLWRQVEPLYESLHCHVRARLAEKYGAEVVPGAASRGAIPAHLLGNMWAQGWDNVYDIAGMPESAAAVDVTKLLRAKQADARAMVKYGEGFFSSLGFAPLPETFWERSLFLEPRDRDVVCHASAWDIDWEDDLRIKMCIEVDAEDFSTVHHELGHNYYQRAYNEQPPLFRDSANDGFHEAVGDTVALSVTPSYLVKIGLLDREPDAAQDLPFLMHMALDKVAFLPFALVLDQWRWQVFSGEVPPERWNAAWWELHDRYRGVAPPVERSEADFDPGAKYHVPANVPYMRYFLAHMLQFQLHRGLCAAAGYEGPLHRCSIYGSKAAGERLEKMLAMGASRPWPEALEVVTGQREMDATAILDYFAPLQAWLDEQNQGRSCGWTEAAR